MNCELCSGPGGELLWQDERCRIVAVAEAGYPGFCRVIWGSHVSEMTDLALRDREHLMTVVFAVESALRAQMNPDKINLASFGTLVPHLHWHVIPRFRDDPHFPQPIWAPVQRPTMAARRENITPKIQAMLVESLGARPET